MSQASLIVSPLPQCCANRLCTNKIGEGAFVIVTLNGLQLVMCVPCSLKLRELFEMPTL